MLTVALARMRVLTDALPRTSIRRQFTTVRLAGAHLLRSVRRPEVEDRWGGCRLLRASTVELRFKLAMTGNRHFGSPMIT
jgi:hypothetical protein